MRYLVMVMLAVPFGAVVFGYLGNLFFQFLLSLGFPEHAAAGLTTLVALAWIFVSVFVFTLRLVEGRWMWEEQR